MRRCGSRLHLLHFSHGFTLELFNQTLTILVSQTHWVGCTFCIRINSWLLRQRLDYKRLFFINFLMLLTFKLLFFLVVKICYIECFFKILLNIGYWVITSTWHYFFHCNSIYSFFYMFNLRCKCRICAIVFN